MIKGYSDYLIYFPMIHVIKENIENETFKG